MSAYEKYKRLLLDFSVKHEKEIKSSLNYDNHDESYKNPLSTLPKSDYDSRGENPMNISIFNLFIQEFIDLFFTPNLDNIKADLSHHHNEVHGKTLREINATESFSGNPFLSTEYIKNDFCWTLTSDLISQTLFQCKNIVLKNDLYMFSTITPWEPNSIHFLHSFPCSYCGQYFLTIYDFEKQMFRASDHIPTELNKICPRVENDKPFIYTFNMNIPSKKLILVNEKPQIDIKKEKGTPFTGILRIKSECESYLKHGIACFEAIDRLPCVYEHKTLNEIIICDVHSDENIINLNDEECYYNHGNLSPEYSDISMGDYDLLTNLFSKNNIDLADFEFIEINLPVAEIKVEYNLKTLFTKINY